MYDCLTNKTENSNEHMRYGIERFGGHPGDAEAGGGENIGKPMTKSEEGRTRYDSGERRGDDKGVRNGGKEKTDGRNMGACCLIGSTGL